MAQQVRFDRFDVSNGLSQNNINGLEMDDVGNIWVGTLDGINRYNGHSFEIFKPFGSARGTLIGNHVITLGKGEKNSMWVITRGGGLNEYSAAANSFRVIDPRIFGSFNVEQTTRIQQSGESLLWLSNQREIGLWVIGTDQFLTYQEKNQIKGFRVLDSVSIVIYGDFGIKKLTFDQAKNNEIGVTDLASNSCFGLVLKENKIYALEQDGIVLYSENFASRVLLINFLLYDHSGINWLQLNDFVICDESFWVGGNGFLARFVKKGGEYRFEKFEYDSQNNFSFKGHSVTHFLVDKSENLWIGTSKNGLNYFNRLKNQFQHYSWDYETLNDPDSDPVRAICKTSKNELWLGFDREGVGVLTASGHQTYHSHYFTKSNRQEVIRNVRSIFEDSRGNIWIGVANNLCIYNARLHRLETVDCRFNWNWPHHCYSIKEFNSGTVTITAPALVGTVNLNDGSLTTNQLNFDGAAVGWSIRDVIVDKYKNQWVAKDFFGLIKLEYSSGKMSPVSFETSTLSDKKVYCMLANGDSLWIGTNSGLNLLDIKQNKIVQKYFEDDGLCNNIVYSLNKDDDGNLWMSTNKGISYFDTQTSQFRTFLSDDFFMDDAHFVAKDGFVYYGGYTGVVSFHPSKINKEIVQVKPVIEKLMLFNQQVYPGDTVDGKVIYKQHLSQLRELKLNYKQNTFSIAFNGFPFDHPNSNQFRYRLNGLQQEWIETSEIRTASYTKVPQGDYVFQIQASPFQRNYGDIVELNIKIVPPFWMTLWFKIVLLFIVITFVAIVFQVRIYQIRQRNSWLKKKVDEQTAELRNQNRIIQEISEKLHQSDQSKIRFFMNVSHELRTPLTLILGHLENMSTDSKNAIKSIKNNSLRLLNLINQLIELRKLDQDQLKLAVTRFNLIPFIEEVVLSFKNMADQKNIELLFHSEVKELMVWLDLDKTEKIIGNLLSNAIKYTNRNKVVKVDVAVEDGYFKLVVADEGIGMTTEELEHIFDRFYRSERGQKTSSGHGIGLSMVQGLTQIQHGKIEATSKVGEGSRFTLTFHLGKEHFSPEDFGNAPVSDSFFNIEEIKIPGFVEKLSGKKILIVEDNEELSHFLASLLEKQYVIRVAENGKVALQTISDFMPDLIISDIMMPVMDGMTFCRKVKASVETSHIPFILLTAKTDVDSKIDGFELGVDDFIEKPFHSRVLLMRVQSLLLNREKIKEQFSQSAQKIPVAQNMSKRDRDFIEIVDSIINTNYSESLFSIEILSERMNMSRATFYRKFTDLTGTTPADYLRRVRLRNAFQLLNNTTRTVAEVSEQVGFQSVTHFRKCFKEEFGKSPSEIFKK